jgi:dTDP-4-dehydrorhamnose 3,5-epimerase
MKVSIQETPIRDVIVVSPQVFQDERGFFMEVFRQDEYANVGKVPTQFVQFNHSGSVKNTVRGLHFQWEPPMGKLMRVAKGTAFLVAVDIRKGSPTLGKHFAITLSAEDRKLVWAPAGFARGFAVLSDFAEIEYLTTGVYSNKEPILSGKDAVAQPLSQWLAHPDSNHFTY